MRQLFRILQAILFEQTFTIVILVDNYQAKTVSLSTTKIKPEIAINRGAKLNHKRISSFSEKRGYFDPNCRKKFFQRMNSKKRFQVQNFGQPTKRK